MAIRLEMRLDDERSSCSFGDLVEDLRSEFPIKSNSYGGGVFTMIGDFEPEEVYSIVEGKGYKIVESTVTRT
jgi:hypothetical protein